MKLFLVGLLNFWVLQWFFVRLALQYDGCDVLVGHVWMKRIVPLTGWWGTAYRRI